MTSKKVFLVLFGFLFFLSFAYAEVYVITKQPVEEVFTKTYTIEFDGNYNPYKKEVIDTTIYDYKVPIENKKVNYVTCSKDDGFLICLGKKLHLVNKFRN